jgi:hypothetical protein
VTGVSRGIDRMEVTFDDPHLVANAGLVVPATLMARLGLEGLVDESVRLVGRGGGSRPGRKVLSLAATILAGGSHIDHADALRRGDPGGAAVPGDGPSTLGTFLRSFTFGQVRPARRRDRGGVAPGLAAGGRARRGHDDHRRGLHDL